nr:MAG: hypothetical protein [Sanya astro-like virus 1]
MSQSVARSERILDRLAREDHLTEAAKQWLTVALDPFHDNPTNCVGIPDSQTGDSVVQCIKSSMTIKKPDSITTGTWDCHVVMSPFMANNAAPVTFVTAYSLANYGTLRYDDSVNGRQVAPITVAKYPTGEPAWANPYNGFATTSADYGTDVLALNANFTAGDYRIISQGFEVLNTTASLYQQGLCTVYRSPVPEFDSTTTQATTAVSGGQVKFTGYRMYLPFQTVPNTVSQALRLPGSKQWHAKEGCYVVGRLNTCDSNVANDCWVQPLVDVGQIDSSTLDHAYYMPKCETTTLGTTPAVQILSSRPFQWANMDVSGAFFTGLSLETTLTINWNIYVERFPASTETDLVVLAKPSPQYCPMAFELYKAIAQNLPVGVMQKENGLGDWFRDAVNTAAEFIQPVAAMIPHPAAQVLGKVAGVAKNITRRENESPFIGSEKQEKQFLKSVGSHASARKTEKKEIKKRGKERPQTRCYASA